MFKFLVFSVLKSAFSWLTYFKKAENRLFLTGLACIIESKYDYFALVTPEVFVVVVPHN